MTLLRNDAFDPWRDFSRLLGNLPTKDAWIPAFDIEETDSAYVLRGDVPGTRQKDIEIRIDDGVLSVRGERKVLVDDTTFRHAERPDGQFERRFHLPGAVNEDKIKAKCSDGVLEISLPKQAPVDTSRLIPVG